MSRQERRQKIADKIHILANKGNAYSYEYYNLVLCASPTDHGWVATYLIINKDDRCSNSHCCMSAGEAARWLIEILEWY